MTTGNHDSVRYSLLGADSADAIVNDSHDREEEEDSEDLYTVRTRTMTRSTSIGSSAIGTFAGRLRSYQRVTFLAVLLTLMVIIVWMLGSMDSATPEAAKSDLNDHEAAAGPLPLPAIHSSLRADGSKRVSYLRTDMNSRDIYVSCKT